MSTVVETKRRRSIMSKGRGVVEKKQENTVVGVRELSFVSVSSIDPPATSIAQLKSTAPPIFVEASIPKRQSKKPAVEKGPVVAHKKTSEKSNVGDSIAANVCLIAIDRIFESSLNGEAAKRLASKQKTNGSVQPAAKKSVARKSTGAQRQNSGTK
ncbi:hypothetical protein M3Y98_01044300 [Aphelenchoides besseyi]|nr:hypothetical protein M3Y98_01044300 [Aphelenchoides besseyi]